MLVKAGLTGGSRLACGFPRRVIDFTGLSLALVGRRPGLVGTGAGAMNHDNLSSQQTEPIIFEAKTNRA